MSNECNCVTELQKRAVGMEFDGKKVLKADMIDGMFVHRNGRLIFLTSSEMEVELEGRKRPKVIPVAHSYCPFCGRKYPDVSEKKSTDASTPHSS